MIHSNQQIIACIDGTELSEAVCDYAVWISKQTHAPLTLLHTINHHHEIALKADASGNIGLGTQEHLLDEIAELEEKQNRLKLKAGKLLLNAAKQRVIEDGIDNPQCLQRHGDLIEVVIELEQQIGVLVLGRRGRVHENQPDQIGSKLEAVIRSLHRPILIINDAFHAPQRIMLAYDGGKAAEKAVEMVARSPLFKGLECHLVCVKKNEESAADLLQQAAAKIQASGDIRLISKKLQGKPEEVLCQYQAEHDIDMTVMGAFSHTRLHEMLLGSFTHKMLLKNKKPLLLLR